jgi:hypothetical protein
MPQHTEITQFIFGQPLSHICGKEGRLCRRLPVSRHPAPDRAEPGGGTLGREHLAATLARYAKRRGRRRHGVGGRSRYSGRRLFAHARTARRGALGTLRPLVWAPFPTSQRRVAFTGSRAGEPVDRGDEHDPGDVVERDPQLVIGYAAGNKLPTQSGDNR